MKYIDEILDYQRNMDKPAVIDDKCELTYGELRECSLIFASALIGNGLKGNGTIIIYMEKSVEMVISIFGVLKSGASYVPIDYDLPIEKIEHIISSCKPAFIITDNKGINKLRNVLLNKGNMFIIMDNCKEENSGFANDDTNIIFWSELSKKEVNLNYLRDLKRCDRDIAYMIFTSGSTGRPKGAMIRHNSVEAFTNVAIEFMGYNENMRMLSISPLYFDVSIPDLFCTLRVGGTLILMKNFFMPNDILEALKKYQITDVIMVSSILKLLSSRYSSLHDYTFPKLKTIWYGGENCPVQVIQDVQSVLLNTKFIHGYGQTETTFCAMVYIIGDVYNNGCLPIGKPLPTVKAYALNNNNAVIKPNEIGELYIGGIQVMEGYCNDEMKTNEVLVEDIVCMNDKVYKTGDYVSLDEDENYIFLGRKDDMIKISGKMVYLNEVERALISYCGIKDAFVFSYVDDSYINKMKALVIPETDKIPSKKNLIEFIEKKLPKYMVPQDIKFVYEDQLPKTSTGKIDRKNLVSIFSNVRFK